MNTVVKIVFYAICAFIAIVVISGTVASIKEISETKKEIAKIKAKTKELDSEYHYQRGKTMLTMSVKALLTVLLFITKPQNIKTMNTERYFFITALLVSYLLWYLSLNTQNDKHNEEVRELKLTCISENEKHYEMGVHNAYANCSTQLQQYKSKTDSIIHQTIK